MGLFTFRRDCAEKLEVLTGLINEERERNLENRNRLVELLEKANKKQTRTEALCEDILDTLSKNEGEASGAPFELLFGILEHFELLTRYCARSRDEALAEQVPLLIEKTELLLRSFNIERINEAGIRADTELHSIEYALEPPSQEMDKTVAEILAPGYKIGGRVLQKAKVKAYVCRKAVN